MSRTELHKPATAHTKARNATVTIPTDAGDFERATRGFIAPHPTGHIVDATGRTVIISSHLLAEVQQTCSHVVLMHRGQLISFGPMKKLLAKNRKANNLEEIFLELIGDDLVIGKEKK